MINKVVRGVNYPRTYRHLKNSYIKSGIYLMFLVVLPLFFMTKYLGEFTGVLSNFVAYVLNIVTPESSARVATTTFSFLGNISYINLDLLVSKPSFLIAQIIVSSALLVFLFTGDRAGIPFNMFCFFELMGYLINCIFFLLKPHGFPYGIHDFSQLYVKQQLGIWLAFIVIYGISTAFLGDKGYVYKVISTLLFGLYSFVFGIVRYIVFLYLLSNYSMLYMYVMYFTLGPLFDFLYLVEFYGILVNKLIKIYDSTKGKRYWEWY